MIKIISTSVTNNLEGNPESRHCDIIITDGNNRYMLGRGGLPLDGNLQSILDAEHDKLLQVALSKGDIKTAKEIRGILYNSAWTPGEFWEALITDYKENVGESVPEFAAIIDIFDTINEEWPD